MQENDDKNNDPDYVYEQNVEEEMAEDQEANGSEGGNKKETGSRTWKVLTVDGQIESSDQVIEKPNRRRSHVWKHFVSVNNGKSAKCNYCQKILSFTGSLSNLLRHLRKKHPSVAENVHLNHSSVGIMVESSSHDMDPLIIEVEGSVHDRISSEQLKGLIKAEGRSAKKLKGSDIEYFIKQDHSYIEHHQQQQPLSGDLFAQFIQSELSKFHSEYLKRKCKRAILQVLIQHQQEEDTHYSVNKNDDREEH